MDKISFFPQLPSEIWSLILWQTSRPILARSINRGIRKASNIEFYKRFSNKPISIREILQYLATNIEVNICYMLTDAIVDDNLCVAKTIFHYHRYNSSLNCYITIPTIFRSEVNLSNNLIKTEILRQSTSKKILTVDDFNISSESFPIYDLYTIYNVLSQRVWITEINKKWISEKILDFLDEISNNLLPSELEAYLAITADIMKIEMNNFPNCRLFSTTSINEESSELKNINRLKEAIINKLF